MILAFCSGLLAGLAAGALRAACHAHAHRRALEVERKATLDALAIAYDWRQRAHAACTVAERHRTWNVLLAHRIRTSPEIAIEMLATWDEIRALPETPERPR